MARAGGVPSFDSLREPASHTLWPISGHRVRVRQPPLVCILLGRRRRDAEPVRDARNC